MAGLGQNVNTHFTVRSRMNGSAELNGEQVGVWFFDSEGSGMGFMGDRQMPSAHFEPIQGEPIEIDFTNSSGMPHTIHLHGLDVDQANDGVPQTSFAIDPGDSFTYRFIAPHAGTYHYHCHVDTVVHYHRGMSGAVIVRPPDGSINRAWDGGPTFQEEVLWHLQTYDMSWKDVMVSGSQTARHHPNVFLLNGKQTEQAMTDPYTRLELLFGHTAYIRLVNMGYQWARVSLGGLPFEVVASDGRPMRQVPMTDQWEIGPGERYDLLFQPLGPNIMQPTEPTVVQATIDYLDDYTGKVLGQVATQITIG